MIAKVKVWVLLIAALLIAYGIYDPANGGMAIRDVGMAIVWVGQRLGALFISVVNG